MFAKIIMKTKVAHFLWFTVYVASSCIVQY